MDDNSNIEIINFESVNDDQDMDSMNIPHEEENKNYLNLYFNDKSGLEYAEHNYSMDMYNSSLTNIMGNDSFSSYCSNDSLSCFSEIVNINIPSVLVNETSDKSLNGSFDNCNGKSKLKKTFMCPDPECGKVYKSKENLTLHYRNIHLKEKPYSCKFCSAVFSHRNGNLLFYIRKDVS
jgi:hypothetical protein